MLTDILKVVPADAKRLIVAFSGGIDSTVLLHQVLAQNSTLPLLAWHVNHGLQDAAPAMETFCRELADEWHVELRVDHLQIESGEGNLEARAREARYQCFQQNTNEGDCILTAHHQADQSETVLLNLLRGSGIRGLRGIATSRQLGAAVIIRPMLSVSRQQIRDYASSHELRWFDDPSNSETRHNRNYLRQRVMPLLYERWPNADQQIADSCEWQREAQQLLDELALQDLQVCQVKLDWGDALKLTELSSLSNARIRNLIRCWLAGHGLQLPAASRLATLVNQLTDGSQSAEIEMPFYRLRSYDDHLFLITERRNIKKASGYFEFGLQDDLVLPGKEKHWNRQQVFEQLGIDDKQQSIGIGFRDTVAGQEVSRHHLKHFFQSRRIPPWERDALPLVFIDQDLAGYLL